MPTIYRLNSERISVADAKQLILKALPLELAAGRIIGKPGPDGEPIWDFDSLAMVSAAEAHAPFLDADFLELCKELGFEPRLIFRPAIGGYSGNPEQDNIYMLTHAQFAQLAESHGLTVAIGTASPAPAQNPAEPAPVAPSASSEPSSRKRWTPEKLAELEAYRATHTMPETAAKFGITEQRIRQLLPSAKPKASPFSGLTHRLK
jgi:hypothetical protein